MLLIADITSTPIADIATPLTGFGSVGLAFWLVRYLVSVSMPKMIADFREELRAMRVSNQEAIDKVANTYAAALKQQMETTERIIATQRQDFRGEMENMRQWHNAVSHPAVNETHKPR